MTNITDKLTVRIAQLAENRDFGASELLAEVIAVLEAARAGAIEIVPVARALVRAQPAMAPVWNAALEAVAAGHDPSRFDRFTKRVARARHALSRFALEALSVGDTSGPLRLVTISFSGSVLAVLEAVRQSRAVQLSCAEGRPALEGRRLAARVAELGIPVTAFSDAALGHALGDADAVVVGADAVGPERFLNKSGTRMLTAAALQQGVPVYVAATRDKFVGEAVAARLGTREGAPQEIWETPPEGVTVRNPYFESTPLDLVSTVISDAGLLGAGMVPDVCRSVHDSAVLEALNQLVRS